ncbi:MAG: hypothetical protein WC880_03830 [Candidatus Paceibacterota bacterium]
MSEQPKKERVSESGRATTVSFLTKARRFFGGGVMFAGGSVAYVGAEGNNVPVMASGAVIAFLGALLAGVEWILGEK